MQVYGCLIVISMDGIDRETDTQNLKIDVVYILYRVSQLLYADKLIQYVDE